MSLTTSKDCDRSQHKECDGTAVYFEQDGYNRYVCQCVCHVAFVDAECRTCKGTGKVKEQRHVTGTKVRW